MIDLWLLRNKKEITLAALQKKDPSFDGQLLYDLDDQVRQMRLQVDDLRQQKNQLAQQAKNGVTDHIRTQSVEIGKALKEKEHELDFIEKRFSELYLTAPNIPNDDLPAGGKESNAVIKSWGHIPTFDFMIKNHLELGQALNWIDCAMAGRITASNFVFYKGQAVKLIYALGMFMLKNNIKHGFEPMLPPLLVNERALELSGNFPKFRDQVYSIPEDGLYLTPTSEVNMASMYRDYIFAPEELPVRMTAFTSCFRREAGGYGANERGLIRIHQFEKVELYSICEPEKSRDELERMVACAESILQALDLRYQISLLAAQDCSFQSARTYDIEIWLPGQNEYKEVSSASNCTDFQARRGVMRYRKEVDAKPMLVHTLNASSLALPRLMVALMETYQQADGSIAIPDVLKKEGIFGV